MRPLLCMGLFHHKLRVLHNIMRLLLFILYENIGRVFTPLCLVLSMLYFLIGITILVLCSHPFCQLLYKNFLNNNPLESFILNNLVSRRNSTGLSSCYHLHGFCLKSEMGINLSREHLTGHHWLMDDGAQHLSGGRL